MIPLWVGVLLTALALIAGLQMERMRRRAARQAASFRALFEATGLGVIVVGQDCMITRVNGSAEALSGWRRADLIGRRACAELFSRAGAGPLGCPGLCGKSGAEVLPTPTPLRLAKNNGDEIPVMVSVAPLSGGGGQDAAFLFWDVSEQTRLEAEAALRRRQAEGLREIGREMAAISDLSEGMQRILHRARDLFRMDLVAWGLLNEAAGVVVWQAADGIGGQRFEGAVLPVEGTVMGRILAAGRPYVTHNLTGQTNSAPLFADPPLLTAMAVPLRVRDAWYGVLLCASTAKLELTDEDVMLFTHLGGYLATAVENEELMEQVQHMAALEERHRLARELHDGFGQILTYVGVRNLMINRLAQSGKVDEIIAETSQIKQVLQEAHTDVRRSIFQLKESGDPRAPLPERWRELLRGFAARTGIQTHLELEGKVPQRLEGQVELQLTRILQEALANVGNHSGARTVTVRVAEAGHWLDLSVTDDGCGFDASAVHGPDQHHFGLSIMRERANASGAQFGVSSMRGRGTTISVQMPLRGKEEYA